MVTHHGAALRPQRARWNGCGCSTGKPLHGPIFRLATRRQRENIMRGVFEDWRRSSRCRGSRARAIKHGIERRKSFAARHFVDTLRGLFKWAVAAEHVKSDPTAGKSVAKPKTKGFPEWTEEELDQYEAHWPLGTRERVMWGVFCFTGLRRGDAARLGKQHIRNGVITIDTEKTGTRVTIPVLPELAEILAAGPTRRTVNHRAQEGAAAPQGSASEVCSRKHVWLLASKARARTASGRLRQRGQRTTAPR